MITITDTDLEILLKSLLQRKVCFSINKKNWKTGKLLIFKQNGFFIEFMIMTEKGGVERFEIPIPFNFIKKNDIIIFSYEFSSLGCKDDIIEEIKKIEPNCRSKYFNNRVELRLI